VCFFPSLAREPYGHDMAKTDEFIVGTGINGYDAFFEQDDATGYLYLSDKTGVLYDLHIYNRKPSFNVAEKDVQVVWTDSGDRCGVLIFGKLRGVIGVNGDMCRPAHVMDSGGIVKREWRRGFNIDLD
jgi:hypothetical protein